VSPFLFFIKKLKTQTVEILLKTMGDKGVEVVDSHGSEIIPSFQVESVLDTTGAGDMFAAGFLYKLLKGEPPKKSALFGCKVASLIIQQYGARLTEETLSNLSN